VTSIHVTSSHGTGGSPSDALALTLYIFLTGYLWLLHKFVLEADMTGGQDTSHDAMVTVPFRILKSVILVQVFCRAGSDPGPNSTCGLRLGLLLHNPKAHASSGLVFGLSPQA
jgi:hypothetical protein